MFNANLAIADDKLSCYVIHKYLAIDYKVLAKEFDMDPNPTKINFLTIQWI